MRIKHWSPKKVGSYLGKDLAGKLYYVVDGNVWRGTDKRGWIELEGYYGFQDNCRLGRYPDFRSKTK